MDRIPSLRERNIALIGFMGVGKTTVGEMLSKRLYRDFIDIDKVIEKNFNMKISDIFSTLGEKRFREIEREISIDFCKNKQLKILSLGGGAYVQEEIRKVCLTHCIVISLDISWERWKDRLSLIIDSRPVLHNKSIEEIEALFETRKDAYNQNSFEIKTDNLDASEVVDYLEDLIKFGWELYQPQDE